MDRKKLIPIIAMVSVLLMLVLMYAGVPNSWLAVFAGGVAIAAVAIFGKKDKNKENKP